MHIAPNDENRRIFLLARGIAWDAGGMVEQGIRAALPAPA
jgi:hypothetical protein